jgi:hypothetical protein
MTDHGYIKEIPVLSVGPSIPLSQKQKFSITGTQPKSHHAHCDILFIFMWFALFYLDILLH